MINLKKIIFGTAAIAIAFGGFVEQPAEAGYHRNKESSIVKKPHTKRYKTVCLTYRRTRKHLYQRCQKLKCFRTGRGHGSKCRLVKKWKKRTSIRHRDNHRHHILSHQ